MENKSKSILEGLVPPPGEGPRCRKCANLLDEGEPNCARCGLSVADAERFEDGEAPWERAPVGKEAALAKAQLLWASVVEREDAAKLTDFVDYVLEENLVDFGIRRLQHHLVAHPEREEALEGLSRLAVRLEQRIFIARTQAEASQENFTRGLQRFRSRLMLGALIVWVLILILFSFAFWGNF